MNRRFHKSTINLFDSLVYSRSNIPNKPCYKFFELKIEDGQLANGEQLLDHINVFLSENTDHLEWENDRLIEYIYDSDPFADIFLKMRTVKRDFESMFSCKFKNNYQFVAFLWIIYNQCRRDDEERIESLLQLIRPIFLEYQILDMTNLDIHVIFQNAPDNFLRSDVMNLYLERKSRTLDKRLKPEIVRYYLDGPIESIPLSMLTSFFSYDVVCELHADAVARPFILKWIQYCLIDSQNDLFNDLAGFYDAPTTILQSLPEIFRNDKKVVQWFVSQNGLELQHAGEDLKKNPEIILNAFFSNKNGEVGLDLQNLIDDDDIPRLLESLLKKNQYKAHRLPAVIFERYPQILNNLIEDDPFFIQFAPLTVRSSREKARKIISRQPEALNYFDDSIKADEEIVRIAIRLNGLALEFADPALRINEEIVGIAVDQNGLALEFADPTLRRNKDIIERALNQDKSSFKFILEMVPDRETALHWIQIQPLIAVHLDLIHKINFDDELLKAYIISMCNIKNRDLFE